jgi:hypothetical protein
MNNKILLIAAVILMLYGCRSSIVDDPTTSIAYAIQEKSYVTLTVENSYDTIIAKPVNGVQDAGVYSVSFDASHLPEGMYFYTIEIRGIDTPTKFSSTKMMLLIK